MGWADRLALRHLLAAYAARPNSWFARKRQARYEFFRTVLQPRSEWRVLDIGIGTGGALERFNPGLRVVGLNLELPDAGLRTAMPDVRFVVGDGRFLPFTDGSVDVVFCSSVIEHVGGPEDRERLAREIRRVARAYYVQTPNRHFPIEPHYLFPFFQYLPERAQRALTRRFALGHFRRGSYEKITLLAYHDLVRLFPDAVVFRERCAGLTKSFMVVRQTPPEPVRRGR